jgi:hypothetical protein
MHACGYDSCWLSSRAENEHGVQAELPEWMWMDEAK